MFMLNGWSQSGKLCTVQSMLCKMVYKYTNSYTCIWCSDFGSTSSGCSAILFNVHKYQQVLFDLPPTATKESNHRTKELVKNENKMKCQSRSEKENSIFKNCERIDWKILLLRKGHFDLYIRISFFFYFSKAQENEWTTANILISFCTAKRTYFFSISSTKEKHNLYAFAEFHRFLLLWWITILLYGRIKCANQCIVLIAIESVKYSFLI